jgi:hypothetical protein
VFASSEYSAVADRDSRGGALPKDRHSTRRSDEC